MPKTFTEEELQAQIKAEKDRLTAEFAEKTKAVDDAAKAAQQKEADMTALIAKAEKAGEEKAAALFAEKEKKMKSDAHKKEVSEFISSSIQTGKILPAWEKMGLAQFMETLPSDAAIEFGEEGAKVSKTLYEFFRSFLAEIPKTVNFGEFAGRDKNVGGMGSAGSQLNDLTVKKMKDDPKLAYTIAFAEVQRENPDLIKEYDLEIHSAH